MDELHRRILQSNRSFMVNNIDDVGGIVDSLYEKDILTEGMRQDIMQGEKTIVRQVRKLLDFLPKRGPFAFDIFCNVLIQHKQRHVAEHINPTLIDQGARPLPPTANQIPGHSQPAENHQQATGGTGHHPAGGNNPTTQRPRYPQPMSYDIHKGKQNSGWSLPPAPEKNGPNKPPAYGRRPSGDRNSHQPDESIQVFQFPDDWPNSLNMAPFNSRDFAVDSCTHEDIERIGRKRIYRMSRAHRGKAIIIKNQEFSGNAAQFAKRSGSEMDSNRLERVLKDLAFQVQIKLDLNYQDLNQLLQRLKESDHDDAFILVILSYGGDGTIFCEDGKEMKIKDIIDIFSAENCKSLRGKPKLFFIQACGSKLRDVEAGSRQQQQSEVDHEALIVRGLEQLRLRPHTGDEIDTCPGPDAGLVPVVPSLDTSDTLVAMATSPDVEDIKFGSLFILALSYVFCHCSKNQDLETMLKRINQLMKSRNAGRFEKLCEVRSSLKRQLFLPGYPLKGSDPDSDFPIGCNDLPEPSFGSTQRV